MNEAGDRTQGAQPCEPLVYYRAHSACRRLLHCGGNVPTAYSRVSRRPRARPSYYRYAVRDFCRKYLPVGLIDYGNEEIEQRMFLRTLSEGPWSLNRS